MFIFVSRFLPVPPQPPVIVGLEKDEVKAGRMLVLECVSYGGSPLATLLWTKVNLLHHLLRTISDTPSHRWNELVCFKNLVASVIQSLNHVGPCNYPNMRLMLTFFNFTCSSHVCQNGEVLSMIWEEDIVAQKSVSVLNLKITPTDNQAVLSCESVNMVSLSPLSVSRKITVLCE